MPVAYLMTPGLRASLRGERLEITPPDDGEQPPSAQRWVPLHDLERVVIDAGVHLSSRSVTGLLEREIPIVFLRHGNLPAGLALPFQRQTLCLANQLDCCRNNDFRLRLSRQLMVAKIRNMRRVIQRLSANRKQSAIAIPWLTAMANQAEAAASLDSLRGIEGAATGRYFEVLASFFPDEIPFERRSRRPPHNEANALLSFLYTLLSSEFNLALRSCGLEPGWGVYHESEDGRPALSLDLMEPFRAPVVDSLALDLLNHHRLKKQDFSKIDGGILLKPTSRRKVFTAWEDRLEREFLYEVSNQRTSIRKIIHSQGQELKKAFRGDKLPQSFLMN